MAERFKIEEVPATKHVAARVAVTDEVGLYRRFTCADEVAAREEIARLEAQDDAFALRVMRARGEARP